MTVELPDVERNGDRGHGLHRGQTAPLSSSRPAKHQKTIEVQTSQDELDEANEEFSVELSNPNGATLSKGTGTGTITDDDEPTLSIEDATAVVEGGTAEFVVEMSIPSTRSVTVDYQTADGSARAGMDYTATPGSLTFSPNTTRQTIRVPTQDDATDELVETFTVTLRNPSGATLADGTATGTINDNDVVEPLHRRRNGRRREHGAVRRDAEPGERPDRNGELRDGDGTERPSGSHGLHRRLPALSPSRPAN